MIPDESRFILHAIREGLPEDTYRDHIWLRRDIAYNGPTKSTGAWPHVRAADQPAESKVNVSRLPAKLRAQR